MFDPNTRNPSAIATVCAAERGPRAVNGGRWGCSTAPTAGAEIGIPRQKSFLTITPLALACAPTVGPAGGHILVRYGSSILPPGAETIRLGALPMRYFRLFLVYVTAGTLDAHAAAVLHGVVLANELGGRPMPNVAVAAAVGGNTNNTDANGKFTLSFPHKNPGDTVRLLPGLREGYAVVNEIQLEQTLPSDPDARPTIILLCKEGDREEMARRFYRLKSLEAIDETYRRKLAEVQATDAAAIAKLRRERDQAKAAAEKVAEGLAKEKPGTGSDLYQAAMRLFLDGKVDEALANLSDAKLQALTKAAQAQKAEAEKAMDEAVQAWLLKAQLLTVQFRFDGAEKAYQEAINASPDSVTANFAFGRFNQDLNHYDKAGTAYERCLELARQKGNNADIA